MDKNELWQKYLPKIFEKHTVSEEAVTLGIMLGTQKIVFKQAYLAYLKHEEGYEHKPALGAKIGFKFNSEAQSVVISRANTEFVLDNEEFQRYMGLVDAVFNDIHPIGTVVELDEAVLPSEVMMLFGESELGLLVTLHARKTPIEEENYLIDYVGTIWPFGMLPEVEPIFINNLMIKKVVSQGLTNEYEERFAWEALRKKQVREYRYSYIFTDEYVSQYGK